MKTTSIQSSKTVTAEPKQKQATGVNRAKFRNGLSSTFVTLLALAMLFIFLAPFAFMVFTSLQTQAQISIEPRNRFST